jgi:hypothetical protein
MIALTVLTGRHAGKTATMSYQIDPLRTLGRFAKSDVRWRVDYKKATHSEHVEWSRADIVGRILGALYHGRPVMFDTPKGIWEWQVDKPRGGNQLVSGQQALAVVNEIVEIISDNVMTIYIVSDDHTGIIIGTHNQGRLIGRHF